MQSCSLKDGGDGSRDASSSFPNLVLSAPRPVRGPSFPSAPVAVLRGSMLSLSSYVRGYGRQGKYRRPHELRRRKP